MRASIKQRREFACLFAAMCLRLTSGDGTGSEHTQKGARQSYTLVTRGKEQSGQIQSRCVFDAAFKERDHLVSVNEKEREMAHRSHAANEETFVSCRPIVIPGMCRPLAL